MLRCPTQTTFAISPQPILLKLFKAASWVTVPVPRFHSDFVPIMGDMSLSSVPRAEQGHVHLNPEKKLESAQSQGQHKPVAFNGVLHLSGRRHFPGKMLTQQNGRGVGWPVANALRGLPCRHLRHRGSTPPLPPPHTAVLPRDAEAEAALHSLRAPRN